MTIQVTGVLNDSSGAVSPNTPLQFVTIHGYAGTLRTATFDVLTGNDGSYDFTLATGKHVIYVKYGDRYAEIGSTIINSETPSPLSISELLNQTEPLAPDEIATVRELVSQAQDSANRAETAATAAEADRAEVASNTATVQTNTNTVLAKVAEVESDRAEVADNAALVQTNTNTAVAKAAEVESDRAEVATNKATVSADKAIVAGYKTEAQRWATGISGSGVNTPSDSNNAFYYSEVARNNANQTFKSGGYFTPTAGQEYPNVTSVEVDTIWLVKFASETGLYTFTTGDLAGQTVKNGFMLVYDTPVDTFDYIPTTLSGVASVNGVVPDTVGNIAIDAADVGAPSNSDARLSNSREWTASTVSQAEAEAGTATTRRAWTAQRVRQAIAVVTNGITLSALGGVPTTRTVNSKALSTNVTLNSSDVGAVPTGRTVNSKALSSNIVLNAADVGAVSTTAGAGLDTRITANANSISSLQTAKADNNTVIKKSNGTTGGIDVPRWTTGGRPDTTGTDKAILGFNTETDEYEAYNPETQEWGSFGQDADYLLNILNNEEELLPNALTTNTQAVGNYDWHNYRELHIVARALVAGREHMFSKTILVSQLKAVEAVNPTSPVRVLIGNTYLASNTYWRGWVDFYTGKGIGYLSSSDIGTFPEGTLLSVIGRK